MIVLKLSKIVDITDWLNEKPRDEWYTWAQELIESLCLHYKIPKTKVPVDQIKRLLEQKNLFRALSYSEHELARSIGNRYEDIHPLTLGSIKFNLFYKLEGCPEYQPPLQKHTDDLTDSQNLTQGN